ncbi:hypothetical protein BDV12DRAFT_199097 [Aspergillus spectabilis]
MVVYLRPHPSRYPSDKKQATRDLSKCYVSSLLARSQLTYRLYWTLLRITGRELSFDEKYPSSSLQRLSSGSSWDQSQVRNHEALPSYSTRGRYVSTAVHDPFLARLCSTYITTATIFSLALSIILKSTAFSTPISNLIPSHFRASIALDKLSPRYNDRKSIAKLSALRTFVSTITHELQDLIEEVEVVQAVLKTLTPEMFEFLNIPSTERWLLTFQKDLETLIVEVQKYQASTTSQKLGVVKLVLKREEIRAQRRHLKNIKGTLLLLQQAYLLGNQDDALLSGWTFTIRAYNVLRDNAPAITYCQEGNMEGLQGLFAAHQAAPNDCQQASYLL